MLYPYSLTLGTWISPPAISTYLEMRFFSNSIITSSSYSMRLMDLCHLYYSNSGVLNFEVSFQLVKIVSKLPDGHNTIPCTKVCLDDLNIILCTQVCPDNLISTHSVCTYLKQGHYNSVVVIDCWFYHINVKFIVLYINQAVDLVCGFL